MFNRGSADFRRESAADCVGDGGLSLKASRYEAESYPLHKLDCEEKKAIKLGNHIAPNGPSTRVDLLGRPVPGSRYRLHSERYRRIQLSCYNFLERPRGLPVIYHVTLCILVVVSLILAALSTVHTDEVNYEELLFAPVFIVEILLVVIFVTEYVLRLWAAGCRSTYVGINGRLRFAKKTYAILDGVVIISSIAALAVAAQEASTPIRLVRFLPLLRVLRFDRQGGTWKLLASVIYVHRQELITTLYLGFLSLIFSSFVLYLVEKDANKKFDSWPNSFWWGIVTLTTIGYGDKAPITWYGRLCASLFAVCGISFFALPAGILGSGFALKVTQQQRQKHFHRRRRPAAILLQSYWRMYCADIQSMSVATWLPHIYYNQKPPRTSAATEKTVSSTAVDNAQMSTATVAPTSRKGRKLSVWRNRNEGKNSRSSADITKGSKPESLDNYRKGSLASTLDTGFFDEANISISEDGEAAVTLTQAQKHAIRLIRLLKLKVAIRKFKEARRPYDVKDVIEQYSTGHVEMLARMRSLQQKMDRVQGPRETDEDASSKTTLVGRLMNVEHQVTVLDHKVDVILSILTKMAGNESIIPQRQFYDSNSRGPGPPGGPSAYSHVQRTYSDPTDSRTLTPESNKQLPTLVVGTGTTASLPERVLSESYPTPSSVLVCKEFPASHSQSYPVLHLDSVAPGIPDINYPAYSSQSSEDSPVSADMDRLNAPGGNCATSSRPRGMHGRQLSDVTEGDESVGSDSKENSIEHSLSGDNLLMTIEDVSEPNSPIGKLDPYDFTSQAGPPEDVWQKQEPVGPLQRRLPSSKTSSDSSFGTLIGEGSKEEYTDPYTEDVPRIPIDIYSEGDVGKGTSDEEVPGAPHGNIPPEGVPTSVSPNSSVMSVQDGKGKRRPLQRTSPIQV